jgi:FkbM family methyltransferase
MRTLAAAVTGRLTRMGLNGPAGARKATAFLLGAIDDRLRAATPHGGLTLRVASPLERWRAETLLDKEPDTIAWLESTIAADSVLYDVGANIGVYALYAAHIHRGRTRVLAFEPEALNFARLYRNIFDNNLSATVGALPIAIGRESGIGRLNLSGFEAGAARHVAASEAEPDTRAEWLAAHNLDAVAAMVGPPWSAPTHLKIDVDGPELDVLEGARSTLRAPSLRHVLVELSAESAKAGIGALAEAGFRVASVGEVHSGWANHIFVRERAA